MTEIFVPFRALILTAGVLLILGWDASAEDEINLLERQWNGSPHAASFDTPEKQDRMNQTGCAHCHTGTGYREVILEKRPSSAPYDSAFGLTCEACHVPDHQGLLRAVSVEDACDGCHNELVFNQPDKLSWCAQFDLFFGRGQEFAGVKYPQGLHEQAQQKCVTCHMAETAENADPLQVGGHTFRVMTKGDADRILNSAPCLACHHEMSLSFVEDRQEIVRQLLAELNALLPQKPQKQDSSLFEPKYPADPSLTEIQAKASYNYYLVQRDGTCGVHNPSYTRKLLTASIEVLKAASDQP